MAWRAEPDGTAFDPIEDCRSRVKEAIVERNHPVLDWRGEGRSPHQPIRIGQRDGMGLILLKYEAMVGLWPCTGERPNKARVKPRGHRHPLSPHICANDGLFQRAIANCEMNLKLEGERVERARFWRVGQRENRLRFASARDGEGAVGGKTMDRLIGIEGATHADRASRRPPAMRE